MNEIFSKLKYPKFLLLGLTFIVASLIFFGRNFLPFYKTISSLPYFGTFFAGIFFVYSFTAVPASAVLLILAEEQNIFLLGFIAAAGALAGDLLIFEFIRHSFEDEIAKLSMEKSLRHFTNFKRRIPKFLRKHLAVIFALFLIASPLPDEIGVPLLASVTKISVKWFVVISYLLHMGGIFAILVIGKFI